MKSIRSVCLSLSLLRMKTIDQVHFAFGEKKRGISLVFYESDLLHHRQKAFEHRVVRNIPLSSF